MYPKVYKSNEVNFEHNGEGLLRDTTRCEVYEEDNGLFELELECPVSSFLIDKLTKETIIKAWASNELKEQLFRIYNIDDSINGIRVVKAQHISYDLLDNFIPSIEVVNISCEQALNEIFKHCAYQTRFKGFSDITHNGSIILQRVNPFEAIKGVRGSIVDTFGNGAKIIKDNFNIKVMRKRGSNNNVLIAHKKNLTGFNGNVDLTGVHTCIYPFAKVQKQEGTTTIEDTIQLPEKYVYSKYHQHFNHLKILPVDFSGEDVKDIESLRKKSETYFDNKSDIPKVNYKVSFISLFETINYKDYKCLETVNMGDSVIIRDYRFNLDVTAEVIKTKHCSLTRKLISCELGNFKYSLSTILDDINNSQANIVDRVDKIKIDIDNELGQIRINIEDDLKGLQTQITANTEGIKSKVSNGEFESYKTQTANQISQKVSAGDVNSIIQQNPGSVQIGFNGINDVIKMIPQGLRVNHGANYSLLSGNGLLRYDSGTGREYHHLIHIVGFTTTGDTGSLQWIQLPGEFRGKKFGAYATLSDTWEGSWDYGEPWVIQRMVAFVKEVDYANARVGIQGYRTDKNYNTGAYRHASIAGMLFVVA